MTKEEVERNAERWLEIIRSFIDKRDKLNVRRDELLQEMKQFQEDYIKALPVKIGDKIMDERSAFQNSSISFTIGKVYVCDIEFDPFLPYGEKRWYL